MTRICIECGHEIPANSDFCYYCGRKVDSKTIVEPDLYAAPRTVTRSLTKCVHCGHELNPGDRFCQDCGASVEEMCQKIMEASPVIRQQPVIERRKLTVKDYLVIVLSAIIGLIPLFGIGHLYYRRYLRGVMYLLIALPLIWFRFVTGGPMSLFLILVWFGAYFFNLLEVISMAVFRVRI